MAALSPDTPLGSLEIAWQSVATLKLQLGDTVRFYKHHYRGSPWLIIANQRDESYFRCSYQAENFLRLLDGSRTIEQALADCKRSNSVALFKRDVIVLLANLKSAGLLVTEGATSKEGHSDASAPKKRGLNPFAIKIPLIDPDSFLDKTAHYVKPLLSPLALLLWIGVVLSALSTIAVNGSGLAHHSAARFTDPQNLMWYWMLYPLVKMLHEFGHAYVTKIWGGTVREMGITFLVFFPVPYVDSSASHRFSSKNQRLLVCGAGIMVELFLASAALLVWSVTDPGLVRDLAFDIAVIGGISTLLFNANPLLRFDGYYLLCELLEIPNLGTRSDQYIRYLFKKFVLDMPDVSRPVSARGEVKWLFCYGVLSRIYRVLITLFIASWVAGKFLVIGVLLAVWAIVGQIFYPLIRSTWNFIPQVYQARRMSRLLAFTGTMSLLIVATLITPVGHSTYSEGTINLPEQAFIRAKTTGVVSNLNVPDGAAVDKGSVILGLEDIELKSRLEKLVAQLNEVNATQQSVFLVDRMQSGILSNRAEAIEADIEQVKTQISDLDIVSGSAGRVSLTLGSDLLGRYVKRGDVLGYVYGVESTSAMVVVPQVDIEAVRNNLLSIEAKLSSRPGDTFTAEFARELPLATDRLPNKLLGSQSGGLMKVDARDPSGVQLLSNVFLVEIALPMETSGSYLGQKVHVRFVHDKDALLYRYFRKFRGLVSQVSLPS
ncbi:MAG: hypothetical protein AB8B84_06060 [Granulosicoccus sp.]